MQKKNNLQSPIEQYDSAKRPHPLVEEIIALIRYRELITQFVSRAIKTRYKRSFLGVFWTMLNPLLMMIVLTLVFSTLFRFSVEDYAVYVLCGLVVWNFFSSTTSSAMSEMIWSGSLLGRIYVPKSIFAVAALGTGLVNLGLSLIPLFGIAVVLGVTITPAVLVMPLAVLLLSMFSLGVGLLLATAVVYFADMLPVYEVILMLWMYYTPIIYPIEIIPDNLVWLFKLNPLYHLLELFRAPLYEGVVPDASVWLIASAYSIAALIIGGLVFTAKSDEYAYRI